MAQPDAKQGPDTVLINKILKVLLTAYKQNKASRDADLFAKANG